MTNMDDNERSQADKSPSNPLQLAALAMAALVPLYIILGYFITNTNNMVLGLKGSAAFDDIWAFPLGLITLAGPLFFAWRMDNNTPPVLGKIAPASKPEDVLRKLVERIMTAFIMRLIPGVAGLGLTIMRMELYWVVVMGAASLAAMYSAWPSTRRLKSLLERIYGQGC